MVAPPKAPTFLIDFASYLTMLATQCMNSMNKINSCTYYGTGNNARINKIIDFLILRE